jgi:hypothetical protein
VGQSLLQARESRVHLGPEHGRNRRSAGIGDGTAYQSLVAFLRGQAESVC